MNLDRFTVKFFAKPGASVDEAVFIEIFHEWIRQYKLPGVLLDVVDYRHVPNGPGVMLITHDINFALDHGEGRFGLLAQRKAGRGDELPAKLLDLIRQTVNFAFQLETDFRVAGKLRFEAGGFELASNDRLLAPNTAEAFAELQPAVQAVAAELYPGREVAISWVENDPRQRLTIRVAAGALATRQLLNRVGAPA